MVLHSSRSAGIRQLSRRSSAADALFVGVEDRDWYREERRASRHPTLPIVILGPIVVLLLIGLGSYFIRGHQPSDPEHQVHHDLWIGLAPGLQIQLSRAPLYAEHDPWKAYLASEETCPGGEDVNAPLEAQAQTMVCLIDSLVRSAGLVFCRSLRFSPQRPALKGRPSNDVACLSMRRVAATRITSLFKQAISGPGARTSTSLTAGSVRRALR